MAYQVLARKYRPQVFSDVAGQDHVTRTLLNALAQGRIAHGYIFSGHRGIGKTTIARILAMALNCRTEVGTEARPTPEPCGICESCTEVRAGNAVDVIEIDAATNRGIDEIRELRDAARYRPARDRYKIYILDEAHQITDAAFNALLKTLEEPPDHVVFMMATTQPEDIPQTIRSRCQHFSFHAVKFDDILIQLRTIAAEEKIGAGDEALALLAEAGDGSMRDALSIMDQAIASAPLVQTETGRQPQLDTAQIRELMGAVPNTVFERLMEAIGENQSAPVIEEINRLLNAGNSASQLARQFVRYLRNVLMARIAGEATELLQLSPDERARTGRSALLFSEEDLTRFLGVMLRTFDELNYRQEPRFHLELGLLKLVHLQRLLPVEQLLSQLGPAAPRPGGGPLPGRPVKASAQANAPSVQIAANNTPPGLREPSASRGSTVGLRNPPAATPEPWTQSTVEKTISPASDAVMEHAAFSPFEADGRRKGFESSRPPSRPQAESNPNGNSSSQAAAGRPQAASASAQVNPNEPAFLREPTPAVAHSSAADDSAETDRIPIPAASAPLPGIEEQWQDALPPEAVRLSQPAVFEAATADYASNVVAPGSELSAISRQVCAALEQAGHNTAAALLRNAEWSSEGDSILVQVAAKKTMLGLTMNAEAEKICRATIRSLTGRLRPISFIPADGGRTTGPLATGPAASRPSASGPGASGPGGSVQMRAMENPLVKQAQELFSAEVRSVVDLRSK